MPTGKQLTLRASALFVALCVMQVYVPATPTDALPPVGTTVAGALQTATFKTTNNQPIIVNGNRVNPGTTILPGSVIETPQGVRAILRFGEVELEIAPGSELTANFNAEGNVNISLRRGCALLRGNSNSTGAIHTPDGTSRTLGDAGQIEACYAEADASPTVNQGTGGIGGGQGSTGGLSKALIAVLIAGGAGAAIIAIILANRGNDPSPSVP